MALLIGSIGFAASAVTNVNQPRGDHEFGPLAVGVLIAFHAGIALWTYAGSETSLGIQREHQGLG